MTQQPYKWMTIKDDKIILEIKVIPNSSKNEFVINEDMFKLKLTAPPVDNKANKSLTEYFSKTFKLAKNNINILSGSTSKNKRIELPKQIIEKIEILVNNC